jgi:hypothetical protein
MDSGAPGFLDVNGHLSFLPRFGYSSTMTNRTIAKVESLETLAANDLKPKNPTDLRTDKQGVLFARLVPPAVNPNFHRDIFIIPSADSFVVAVPNQALLLRAVVTPTEPYAGQKYITLVDSVVDPFPGAPPVDIDSINLANKPVVKFDYYEEGGKAFGDGITIAFINLISSDDKAGVEAAVFLEWIDVPP